MGVIFLIAFAVWGFYGAFYLINDSEMWKRGKNAYKDLKAKRNELQKIEKQIENEEKTNHSLQDEIKSLESTKDALEAKKKAILAAHAKSLKSLRFLSLLDAVGAKDIQSISNKVKALDNRSN